MPQDVSPKQGKPRWTGGAIALFVIGLLILVPSGLCTALIGLPYVFSDFGRGDGGSVLLVGGGTMALGAALVYAGLKFRRRA